MKKLIACLISASLLLALASCGEKSPGPAPGGADDDGVADGSVDDGSIDDNGVDNDSVDDGIDGGGVDVDGSIVEGEDVDGIRLLLSDDGVQVSGGDLPEGAVYTDSDIVYYESGHDFTYGEGTSEDEHSAEEAAAHTVVHITAPGTYVLSGKLSAGQIAVDLGDGAEDDPEAVVTLVLNGVDITCTVAPAIIFYNVYECGDKDSPQSEVDTSAAGANIHIADGSRNSVSGSYVAKIYKSVELSEDGKSVLDSKKLHKYDGAVYSKMSMNVDGADGVLRIEAENEGLDSELHLTINGGVISISSGNDGINTNEDGVSVTTINGGSLTVTVNGSTGEGDGIDSNGWLVINGGVVRAYACPFSGDAGIDSDMGIIINGGEVTATGNMLDAIDASSTQGYVIFNLQGEGGALLTLKDAGGEPVMDAPTANDYSILIVSSPAISEGLYALYDGGTLLGSAQPGGGDMGRGPGFHGGGRFPGDGEPPVRPGDENPPEDGEFPRRPGMPEGGGAPDVPEDGEPPEQPEEGEPPEWTLPTPPEGDYHTTGEGASRGEEI